MITKGTEEYKKAQQVANQLQAVAAIEKWNSNSRYNLYYNDFYAMIQEAENTNTFAAQVAKTINDSSMSNTYNIARVSSKQAWILACAIVENNIENKLN